MAIRSGLGAQLGGKRESAVGTYVAPTNFVPFTTEGLELDKTYIRSHGLRAGRLSQSQDLHVATTRTANGPITFEWLTKGMGMWLDLLHGDVITPVQQAATTAYLQTHNIGLTDPFGKALTIQIGRPGTDGTVRPFSYLGCKLTQAEWKIDSGGVIEFTATIDAKDEDTGQTLATATYSSGAIPFDFTQIIATTAGSAATNVRSLTITASVPQATDRFHLGNSGVKDEPIANDLVAVTAEAVLEFKDLTDHNRFTGATVVSFVADAVGATIASTYHYETKFTLPAAKQVSSGPKVDGPDIVTTTASYEALDNGSAAPLTVAYCSTDITI